MVYDAKSRGFRGYCFIYYNKLRDATTALNETNGLEVKDRRIRVDYSKTKRAHTPTPGFYRGNRGHRNRSFERHRPPPPRHELFHSAHDRYRKNDVRADEYRRNRSRSRERFERPMERPFRDFNRDREMRGRSDVRRRSIERAPMRRSPRRDSFRRRDRN